jgi:hypothetical protein
MSMCVSDDVLESKSVNTESINWIMGILNKFIFIYPPLTLQQVSFQDQKVFQDPIKTDT